MINKPFLRIVIPTFNRSDMLIRLIKKIYETTKISEIEIIVVDDHSEAIHVNKLKDVANELEAIKFIYLPRNSGGSHARNIGAFYSPADWVWFIDDDDLISADTILDALEILKSIKNNEMVFLCAQTIINGEKTILTPNGENLFKRFSLHGNEVNTSCVIFKKSLLERLNGWDAKLIAGQDTDLLLRASEFTDAHVIKNLKVGVVEHTGERITTNPKKQMIGKIQFIAKNYSKLHPFRLFRYIITTITFYPYIRKILKI